MKLDSIKQTFIVETSELLSDMEAALLHLEKTPDDEGAIHAVFRAAHTIKGSSGMFGYQEIVNFTHVMESFLEELRQGKFQVNSDMIAALLESGDFISELVNLYTIDDARGPTEQMIARGKELLSKLTGSVGRETTQVSEGDQMKNTGEPANPDAQGAQETQKQKGNPVQNPNWHISIRPGREVFRHGLDPLSFINYLSGLGEIVNLVTLTGQIPAGEELEPEECYLGYEISLKSDTHREEIENVFEFLKDEAAIFIIEPHGATGQYKDLIESVPEENDKMENLLVTMGVLEEGELSQETQSRPETTETANEPVVHAEPETAATHPAAGDVGETHPEEASGRRLSDTTSKFIRIEAKKLDSLINLVGELVINVANIRQISEANADKEIVEASLVMSRLVEEVRDSAMNIRMVQIGDTFRRFERVVRDLSRQMGKEINLEINGGDTELDKTVVEKINDPLMHLIRNAIDHGIGKPEDRVKAGKTRAGKIEVNAYHDTGNIVIEIADDGEGINRKAVLNKALETGLAKAGQEYTEDEINRFILEPGFSTAKTVTDVSGRGVGMDVVKRNIEALRGTVDIESLDGQGTTMRIQLPLTLAIIDGFLVEIGSSSYVIPLDMVLECINVSEEHAMGTDRGNFVNLRGEVLPYLRMREFFNEINLEKSHQENIIVVKYGQHKAGLVVDRLLGEFQTVIKPLGKLFSRLQGISGATILGSGEVALILDIPKLIRHAQNLEDVTRTVKAGVE